MISNDLFAGGLERIWRISVESGRVGALKRIDPSPLQVLNQNAEFNRLKIFFGV
jgi:hypothetical protein